MWKKLISALFTLMIALGAVSAASAQTDADDTFNQMVNKALEDSSFKVRLQAIMMLGRMGNRKAVEPLLRLTKDEDYAIRGAAAISLGNIGEVSAIPGLFEMAKDNDKFVRRESVKALKKIVEKERAVTEVLAYVRKSDERVRAQAIELLGEIQNPAALKAVIRALADDDEEVAKTAEEAIMKRPQQEVVNILLQALYDKTPGIRLRVINILAKIKDPRAINVLSGILATDIPGVEAEAAKKALIQMQDQISLATTITTLSNSPDKSTRNRMLYLLEAKAGSEADREAVITTLRSALLNDADHFIRGRAAQIIASIGAARLIPDLQNSVKLPANKDIVRILQKSIELLEAKQKAEAAPAK